MICQWQETELGFGTELECDNFIDDYDNSYLNKNYSHYSEKFLKLNFLNSSLL